MSQEEYEATEKKLQRATKLMVGLGGEKTRYTGASEQLAASLETLIGDSLVTAGVLSYLGPFTSEFRAELMRGWLGLCERCGVPASPQYSVAAFIGDPVQTQRWQLQGLPADPFSVDNALIAKQARRWPLLVDPQGQVWPAG